MTSKTIYCVYLTSYSGNKLPPFYIGSTSVDRIDKGYHGSVRSKKYKNTWNSELKINPHLFKTKIIKTYNDRQSATAKELRLQKLLMVVKSLMYINESYAQLNGCFGRDVSGSLNPAYGRTYKPTRATKELLKQQYAKFPKIWVCNNKESLFILESEFDKYMELGYSRGRSFKQNPNRKPPGTCYCTICRREIQINNIGNHWKTHFITRDLTIEYYGNWYESFRHLQEITGCSKALYKKYYLNGIDPRSRIGKNGPIPK
jgi:hypothetical protein